MASESKLISQLILSFEQSSSSTLQQLSKSLTSITFVLNVWYMPWDGSSTSGTAEMFAWSALEWFHLPANLLMSWQNNISCSYDKHAAGLSIQSIHPNLDFYFHCFLPCWLTTKLCKLWANISNYIPINQRLKYIDTCWWISTITISHEKLPLMKQLILLLSWWLLGITFHSLLSSSIKTNAKHKAWISLPDVESSDFFILALPTAETWILKTHPSVFIWLVSAVNNHSVASFAAIFQYKQGILLLMFCPS